MSELYPALISVSDALEKHKAGSVIFIDASMGGRPSQTIPDALYFDIDDVCDPDHEQPHMIPSAELFAEKVSEMGIKNTDHLVVFDSRGMAFAAARVWWLFRLFGHDQISIMDGGIPAYLDFSDILAPPRENVKKSNFTASYNPKLVKKIEEIKENITNNSFQLIDARDNQRFTGIIADPVHNVPSGHIPNSQNLFFMDLIDVESSRLKPLDALTAKINALNLDQSKPIAATCGSGVTACILALALYQTGRDDVAIYDGSWSEWSTSGEEVARG